MALGHAQGSKLRVHREVGPNVAEKRPCWMREVPAIRCQPLNRNLASAQNASMVDVRFGAVAILDDVVSQLSVDRATKSVHQRLLSAPLPRGVSVRIGAEYLAKL